MCLAAALGVPVPVATVLAEALVAGCLAQRTGGGFVAVAELAAGPSQDVLRADLRTGLLQMAALFDEATHGAVTTGWAHTDERILPSGSSWRRVRCPPVRSSSLRRRCFRGCLG